MKKTSDKTMAVRMLQRKKDGGHRFLPFIRMNAKGYTMIGICCGACMGWFAYARVWTGFACLVCYLFGALLRDVSWVISMNRTWPFVERVINWEIVQKMADQNDPSA
jgi:hypothetical protein